MKKKLTPIEQVALKHGLECVTFRKGGKDQTHCAPYNKRALLRNLKGSIVGGLLASKGFKYTPTGEEILHLTDEPLKKKRAKRA